MGWPAEIWNGVRCKTATLRKHRSIQVYSLVAGRDVKHSFEQPTPHVAGRDEHVGTTLCSHADEQGEKHDSISQHEVSV